MSSESVVVAAVSSKSLPDVLHVDNQVEFAVGARPVLFGSVGKSPSMYYTQS